MAVDTYLFRKKKKKEEEEGKQSKKDKIKGFLRKAKTVRNKVMNKASDLSGAKSAVKVGAHLVKGALSKKKQKPLYKKGDYKSLAKDVVGIATLGTVAHGAVKTLAAASQAVAAKSKVISTATAKLSKYKATNNDKMAAATSKAIRKAEAQLKILEKVRKGFYRLKK